LTNFRPRKSAFTAVVTAPGYLGTPTGTVTFTIDGYAEPAASLAIVKGVDQATFTISTLAAGSHTVSAAYSGDTNVAASSGSLTKQTVNAPNLHATTISLASPLSPSTAGQTVTFTAVVSPGTPTGTVTFTIDGKAEPPVRLQLAGGKDQATFSIATLAVGTHTIAATYNGDSTFAASTVPNTLTQTVNAQTRTNNPQATSTTLVASTPLSVVGATVTFTATVAPTAATGSPTGTVTFTIDGVAEPPVRLQPVNGRYQAAFAIATLAPGAHTIVATYNGDATFAASTVARPLTQTVSPLTQTVSPLTQTVTAPIAAPPVVESLKRYGTRARRTTLVLTFSTALDPARASNPANYRITRPNGRFVLVRSVVYDPAAHTVTLTPRTKIKLHRTYHVTVIGTGAGGVADVRGVLLDGTGAGQAGSDFVTTLTRSNLVLAPAPGPKPVTGHR
jgi:hypothetical protein